MAEETPGAPAPNAMLAEAFPAGGFLADELEARELSQAEFAGMIGRPEQFVSEIIAGTRDITAKAAEQIGAALGTGAQLWLNLQDSYRRWERS